MVRRGAKIAYRKFSANNAWSPTLVNHILIGIEGGLLTIHRWQIRPQLPGTLATAIADVKSDDLPRESVHSQPNPLFIRLFPDKAVHLVGFGLKASDDDLARVAGQSYLQMIWSCLKAFDHEVD
jgi:hypothetical protein